MNKRSDMTELLSACLTTMIVWREGETESEEYAAACSLRDSILDKLEAMKEPEDTGRDARTECYSCAHKRSVPGNCHIQCAKPDQSMTGNQHGIDRQWFFYPLLFDPVWKDRICKNYEATKQKPLTD